MDHLPSRARLLSMVLESAIRPCLRIPTEKSIWPMFRGYWVNRQHGIYLMSSDYLTLDKRIFLWDIRGREAPHIFKRNDIYYYGTSKTAGIQSSGTSYYTATNLAGPCRRRNRCQPRLQKIRGIRKLTLSFPSRARMGLFTCMPATAG